MSRTDDQPAPPGAAVLVVEDDPIVAMDIERILEGNGHTVVGPASSVRDALKLLAECRPDTAIIDYNLGSETALPVAVELERREIPFLIASACDLHEVAEATVLRSAQNVGKPFRASRLLAEVENALRGTSRR